MRSARPLYFLLTALWVLCFGLAAGLEPRFEAWHGNQAQSEDVLTVMLGDGRRLFAGYFYRQADVYYHSGYYPTIFDNRQAFETAHMAADAGAAGDRNRGDEEGFLGPPRDWIDAFGRHFFPDIHTHLDRGGPPGELGSQGEIVGEILPWLRLSAELDPNNIQTYTVTAYWLRTKMGKVAEAEAFLHEGLRSNPGNPALLFELGRIYFEDRHDLIRARYVWDAALRAWEKQTGNVPLSEKLKRDNEHFDNRFIFQQLQTHLAELEEQAGNLDAAIAHWERAKTVAPDPAAVQKHIDELRARLAAPTATPATAPP